MKSVLRATVIGAFALPDNSSTNNLRIADNLGVVALRLKSKCRARPALRVARHPATGRKQRKTDIST
jgi:hypothetical protein